MRKHLTIIELREQQELIVRGRVTKPSDGADARGVPYTEVPIAESLKGAPGRERTIAHGDTDGPCPHHEE